MAKKFWSSAPSNWKQQAELNDLLAKKRQNEMEETAFGADTGTPSSLSQMLRTGRVLPSQFRTAAPPKTGQPSPTQGGFTVTRPSQPAQPVEQQGNQQEPIVPTSVSGVLNRLSTMSKQALTAPRDISRGMLGNVARTGLPQERGVSVSSGREMTFNTPEDAIAQRQGTLSKFGVDPSLALPPQNGGEQLGSTLMGMTGLIGSAISTEEAAKNPLLGLGPEAQIATDIALKAAGPVARQIGQGVKGYPKKLAETAPRVVPERQAMGLAKKDLPWKVGVLKDEVSVISEDGSRVSRFGWAKVYKSGNEWKAQIFDDTGKAVSMAAETDTKPKAMKAARDWMQRRIDTELPKPSQARAVPPAAKGAESLTAKGNRVDAALQKMMPEGQAYSPTVSPAAESVGVKGAAPTVPPSPARAPSAAPVTGPRPTRIPDEAPSIEGVGFPQREAPLIVEGAGEGAMPPFGSADSGVPPTVPPAAGGAVPPSAGKPPVGPKPKPVPQGIQEDLAQAGATVVRDRGGIITRLLDRVPGLKQAQRHVHPAVGMPEHILAGHVGSGATAAKLSGKLRADVTLAVKQLDTAFGRDAVSGKATKVARFIGPSEKQVPFSGTLYDIMQRPDMYDLTSEQRALLTNLQAGRSETFNALKEQYGLKIREYPVPEGAVHLGNVSQTEGAIDMAGSLEAAIKRGANKERVWATGADRYLHDKATKPNNPEKWFKPVTDVGALMSMRADQQLVNEASQNVLKAGLKGKTKLEVLTETHPALANRMQGLKNRLQRLQGYGKLLKDEQQEAIDDFLTGAMEDADMTQLYDDLNVKLEPGRYVAKSQAGRTLADVTQEINGVKADITKLRPDWRNANPEPYVMVTEGNLYQYYPSAEAPVIRKLMDRSSHWGFRAADNLRATAFGGDLSPASIQGITAMLLDPLRTGRALIEVGPKRIFSEAAIAADIRANPESWARFNNAVGVQPLAGAGEEFSSGIVGKIPKVGKYWDRFNNLAYRPNQWVMKKSFDSIYEGGLKIGLTSEQAAAIAADDITKAIPQYNYRRLGMSAAQSTRYRAVLTSVSFLTQPAALMSDATKGLIKLGTRQTVTPSEAYAVKRVLTLVAATETVAVTSHALYAQMNGKDVNQAVKDSLDPNSGYFMSAVLWNGSRFGLGGPYRSLIKAVWPAEVKGAGPVPLPFAGIVRYARGKANVGVSLAIDLTRNQDYYGQKIMQGDFPINVLQGAEYALENTLPLTIGSAMEQVRRGTPENIPSTMGSQFAGVNLVDEAPPSVWKAAEETNKTFRRLPYMSKYDVNLGSIGSTWDNIVMTPEQRIVRQNTMGAVVTPRMKAFVESPSFAKMKPDEQKVAIDKEMDRIKGMLTKVYNAYGKGEPAPDLTGKMSPTIKDLPSAEVEKYVLEIESLKPYFDIPDQVMAQMGNKKVKLDSGGFTTVKMYMELTDQIERQAEDAAKTGDLVARDKYLVAAKARKAGNVYKAVSAEVTRLKNEYRKAHPEADALLYTWYGLTPKWKYQQKATPQPVVPTQSLATAQTLVR